MPQKVNQKNMLFLILYPNKHVISNSVPKLTMTWQIIIPYKFGNNYLRFTIKPQSAFYILQWFSIQLECKRTYTLKTQKTHRMYLTEPFTNYQFYLPMFCCCNPFLSGPTVSQFETVTFKDDKEMPSSSPINEVSSVVLLKLQCIHGTVSQKTWIFFCNLWSSIYLVHNV